MLDLASETPMTWVHQAIDNVETLLIDHAQCEKKAASTAIAFLFRYPSDPGMQEPLSALAREELEHYEMVLRVMADRGLTIRHIHPSPYAGQLLKGCRTVEPHRQMDTLLACALIEARSCERMKLLAEHLPDEGLRTFYKDLLATEARHFHLYVDLAAQRFGREEARARLHALADHEAAVLREPSEFRVHSGCAA